MATEEEQKIAKLVGFIEQDLHVTEDQLDKDDPLLEFLKELKTNPRKFNVYCNREKEDWTEDYGKPGRDIYIYLKKNGI